MAYNKNIITVWTKANEVSEFNMLKVLGVLSDVSASTVFDVLNDPIYRKKWDFAMYDGYEICTISPNSDIGYYAMKIPKPLKNRDFVTQRAWLDLGKELMIFNHSVNHTSMPPKKHFIRGISYLTGYHIVAETGNKDEPGCQITYITQSDPRGKLPSWAVNKLCQFMAPKIMSKLLKACRNYPAWKAKHSPEQKPWLFPEQNKMERLNPDDIGKWDLTTASPVIDERSVTEQEINAVSDDDDSSDTLHTGSTETPSSDVKLTASSPEPATDETKNTAEVQNGPVTETVAIAAQEPTAEAVAVTTEVVAVAPAVDTAATEEGLAVNGE